MPGHHFETAVATASSGSSSTGMASGFTTHIAQQASDIPASTWTAFREHQERSNVMFPYALKQLGYEGEHPPARGNVWITIQSSNAPFAAELVLSSTNGPLGKYPIFIFTPRRVGDATDAFLQPRILALVEALLSVVSTKRVYSVFAPANIAAMFTATWTARTHIASIPEPYYDSTLSFCTNKTLRKRQNSVGPGAKFAIRLASLEDIPKAAVLFYQFAATCEPFVMSREHATFEADLLVRQGQLWVHTIEFTGQEPAIASVLAVTRSSSSVAAITKVYTNPNFRRRGCAERLTRRVCMQLLQKRDRVVLYVGNDNPAAHVYAKVGFVGLECIGQPAVDGAERWVETGFQGAELGHW